MKLHRTRLLAMLLCCFLILPHLGGCAQFEAFRYFMTGQGTKDPAAGAVLPPTTGENLSSLTLGYDESFTVTGRFLALEDVETSDAALLYIDPESETDTAFTVRAVGVGCGTLVYELNGATCRIPVTIKPARLAVFFLLGDGDARGMRTEAAGALRAADGLVYYTFPESSSRFDPDTVDDFVVEWLTENEYSKTYMNLLCKTNELTAAGRGYYSGLSSPLAYKWAEQTGEHVWVINLATEQRAIEELLPDYAPYVEGEPNEYERLEAIFASVADTLTREYDAGHYTHARTGWFLSQGEADSHRTAADYLASLEKLSTAVNEALRFTYGETTYPATFGGLIGSRAERVGDLTLAEMTGPRTAQLVAAGMGGDLATTYLLSDMASEWYSDVAVASYFARYDRHKFLIYYGYEPPAKMSDLINSDGSYTVRALNEIAAASVENLLYQTGLRRLDGVRPTVSLLSYNGYTPVADYLTLSYGDTLVAAVPRVSPLWMAKATAATVSIETAVEGAKIDLCRLSGVGNGDVVSVRCTGNGFSPLETDLHVRRHLEFAVTDYPADVRINETTGRLELHGYTGLFTYGYIEQATGAYTVYPDVHYQYGWLYDGKNIWSGHGGICAINGYRFGTLADWDSGYAFTVPESGTASFSVNRVLNGKCDSLFAICLNGQVVWPKQGEYADSSLFYTLKMDATAEDVTAALAGFTIEVKQGDVITFTSRRIAPDKVAEDACHAVVVIE